MGAFGRVQIGANVLEAAGPHCRVEEEQSTRTRVVGEVEDVALDEDLEILELVELKHPKLGRFQVINPLRSEVHPPSP
jgi:hypothetical protein